MDRHGNAGRRRRPPIIGVAAVDWPAVAAELDQSGCALTPRLVTATEAEELIGLYDHDAAFRSTVDMGRHRFGEGEYRYFAPPLPPLVESLRQALYPHLVRIARDWNARLGRPAPWPDTPRRLAGDVPRSRPDQADPTPVEVRSR